jgi:3-methyladenine DNA glycosylase/8-oxoguanine DNA glycosylase
MLLGLMGLPTLPDVQALTLLATARTAAGYDVSRVVLRDAPRPGAIAVRPRPGVVRRAEPGPAGPLVLEARSGGGAIVCEVWGPPATARPAVERALEDTVAWAGLRDTPERLAEVVAPHPLARTLLRGLGEVRLSRLPRVGEALGRSVLSQLVEGGEARRSIAQVAACSGTPAPGRLATWPTAEQLGAVPAWDLRRCGVSLRGARALHAGALADGRLAEAAGDWQLLDRRLRALPGVGAWTSAETRLALGDPDAVSVGDYHLPTTVGNVLTGRRTARAEGVFDDAAMLELLAPFAGQRGRVIRLCELAAGRLVPGTPRRGARAALSAHRYW